jgi:hypothetical protein
MKLNQLIYLILLSSSLIGYYPLSAKNPKKYADTIVLKNGVVLNGIRATDSVVVTTEDGATTIYKRKDISEVKKAGASREVKESKESAENLKSENSTEVETAKKEPISGMERWSGYLGIMRWDEANAQCKKIGMRLPTIGELRDAFINGTTEAWKKDGLFYWSSTPGQGDHSYNIGIADGHFFVDDRIFINDVRCIR